MLNKKIKTAVGKKMAIKTKADKDLGGKQKVLHVLLTESFSLVNTSQLLLFQHFQAFVISGSQMCLRL